MLRTKNLGRAFTLIELLVVVAIIALLIAILLPSLNAAKKSANVSRCLSNVRSIGQSLNTYMADFQRVMPYYNIGPSFWTGTLQPYGAGQKIRACPEAPNPNPSGSQQGAAMFEWQGFGGPPPDTGAYGLNGWLYTPVGQYAPPGIPSWTFPFVAFQSEIPIVADSCWPDGWPQGSDQPPSLQQMTDGVGGANSDFIRRWTIARHGKSVNVAFIDGHAQNMPLQYLWTIKWNPSWVQPSQLPKIP